MISWVRFGLAVNKLLTAIRLFLVAYKSRMDGRKDQADAQAKHDAKAVKRGADARAKFKRGKLQDAASKHHINE